MKPTALIINTSRAAVMNSSDLIFSLENKVISGAAVDVIDNELNFGSNDLFYKAYNNHENLVITPHIGGNTFESFIKTEQFVFNKLIEEIHG